MVKRLKKGNISVVTAFEQFDADGDGYVTAAEMRQAFGVNGLGFDDLSHRDIEILIESMDTDKNGLIDYKEFDFLLQRSGLKSKNVAESMVFKLIRTI
jgi:Ca2+-binding EF-hand superfamily protein